MNYENSRWTFKIWYYKLMLRSHCVVSLTRVLSFIAQSISVHMHHVFAKKISNLLTHIEKQSKSPLKNAWWERKGTLQNWPNINKYSIFLFFIGWPYISILLFLSNKNSSKKSSCANLKKKDLQNQKLLVFHIIWRH